MSFIVRHVLRRFPLPWFGLFALVFAPLATAQIFVSRVTDASVAHPAVAPGDTLTVNFTLAPGSVAPKSVTFSFTSAEGHGRTVTTTEPASGQASALVTASWPNGTYHVDYVNATDSNGRAWIYFPDPAPRLPEYPGTLPAVGPTADFSKVSFIVSGGLATVTPPQLIRVTRTSADTLVAGSPLTFNLEAQPGLTPLTEIILQVRAPDNHRLKLRLRNSAAGPVSMPTDAGWLNGAYVVERVTLFDEVSSALVLRDDPQGLVPASLDFQVTSGVSAISFPQFTSITRTGSGAVTAGATLDLAYTAAGSRPFTYLHFGYVDVTGQSVPLDAVTQSDGRWQLATGLGWVNGRYRLDYVRILDAVGRGATYFRNGLMQLTPGPLAPPMWPIDFAALDFDVIGGLRIMPHIITQPTSATVAPGQTHELFVQAGSLPDLVRFEWYIGQSGDTSHPLTAIGNTSRFTPQPVSATTTYWVRVVTADGSIDSQAATIAIAYPSAAPVIISQPQINPNSSVPTSISTMVFAVGAPPLSYQWFRDGVAIPGATSDRFQLSPAHYTDSGDYTVTVTNPGGSVTSAAAKADIQELPVIVTQPTSQTGTVGGAATLTVKATGGGLSYEWGFRGSTYVRNGMVSTDGTLTISPIEPYNSGTYTLNVRNAAGTVTATPVMLNVVGGPTPVLNLPIARYGEINRPLSFEVRGTPYVNEYRATGLPPGMTIDPVQAYISGTPTAAGTFPVTITATNFGGTTTASLSLVIFPGPFAPIITRQPVSQSTALRTRITFDVAADGTPREPGRFYYQWHLNGVPIEGAEDSTYTVDSVMAAHAGDYTLTIYGGAGTTTSAAARLNVDANASAPYIISAPQNRVVNIGQPTTFTVMIGGTQPMTYRWEKEGGANTGTTDGATGSSFSLASASLADEGNYVLHATNAYGTVYTVGAYLAVANPPAILTQPVSQVVSASQSATLRIVADSTAYIYEWFEGASGDTSHRVTYATSATFVTPPLTATTRYWVRVGSTNGWYSLSTTATVTIDSGAPAPANRPVNTSVSLGGSATFVAAPGGTTPPTFQWSRNGQTIAGAISATLSVAPVRPEDAGIYTVAIDTAGTVVTQSAILGVDSTTKVIGGGAEVGTDIVHANGNIYDQVLLGGAATTITADAGQVVRTSFVDLNGDIVQVEFSGTGTLTLVLENATGPANAALYHQPSVAYIQGHATIVVSGADATTHLAVFSVGRATAVNQGLFLAEVDYDGVADVACIAIASRDGKFGGLRTANTGYFNTRGLTGVYAPGVQFLGPVYVGDITAAGAATPVLLLGSSSDVRITGGDLAQDNARAVQVSGITQLHFTAGTTSHGGDLPAQPIRGRLEEDGADVTAQLTGATSP